MLARPLTSQQFGMQKVPDIDWPQRFGMKKGGYSRSCAYFCLWKLEAALSSRDMLGCWGCAKSCQQVTEKSWEEAGRLPGRRFVAPNLAYSSESMATVGLDPTSGKLIVPLQPQTLGVTDWWRWVAHWLDRKPFYWIHMTWHQETTRKKHEKINKQKAMKHGNLCLTVKHLKHAHTVWFHWGPGL